MNFIRKIAPFLLLSVFCFIQAHAILPHVHHIHDDIENHHDTNHHHHNDQKSHDNHEDLNITDVVIESNDHHRNSDFLIHLFDGHLHDIVSVHDNDLFLNLQKQKNKNSKLLTKFLLYTYNHDILYITKKYRVFNHIEPEGRINDFLIGSYSHRGPPSLV